MFKVLFMICFIFFQVAASCQSPAEMLRESIRVLKEELEEKPSQEVERLEAEVERLKVELEGLKGRRSQGEGSQRGDISSYRERLRRSIQVIKEKLATKGHPIQRSEEEKLRLLFASRKVQEYKEYRESSRRLRATSSQVIAKREEVRRVIVSILGDRRTRESLESMRERAEQMGKLREYLHIIEIIYFREYAELCEVELEPIDEYYYYYDETEEAIEQAKRSEIEILGRKFQKYPLETLEVYRETYLPYRHKDEGFEEELERQIGLKKASK